MKENSKKNHTNESEQKEMEEISQTQKLGIGAFFTFKPELYGFYFGFVVMIVLPILSFFITKSVSKSMGYNKTKQEMYGMISSVIVIWIIMITYAVYYCKEDFVQVFCPGVESQDHMVVLYLVF